MRGGVLGHAPKSVTPHPSYEDGDSSRSVFRDTNLHNAKRGLRGESPIISLNNNITAFDSTTAPPPSSLLSPAEVSPTSPPPVPEIHKADTKEGVGDLLMVIVMFLIMSPCLLASVAQSIYCYKKRKQDRADRALEAVSTNPTSRMLVLNEIFKNDSRQVTEQDASPKKKRVRVKKHRKKEASDDDNNSNDENAASSDEEMGGDSSDDGACEGDMRDGSERRPAVVYISSFDHLDNHGEPVQDEPLIDQEENNVAEGFSGADSETMEGDGLSSKKSVSLMDNQERVNCADNDMKEAQNNDSDNTHQMQSDEVDIQTGESDKQGEHNNEFNEEDAAVSAVNIAADEVSSLNVPSVDTGEKMDVERLYSEDVALWGAMTALLGAPAPEAVRMAEKKQKRVPVNLWYDAKDGVGDGLDENASPPPSIAESASPTRKVDGELSDTNPQAEDDGTAAAATPRLLSIPSNNDLPANDDAPEEKASPPNDDKLHGESSSKINDEQVVGAPDIPSLNDAPPASEPTFISPRRSLDEIDYIAPSPSPKFSLPDLSDKDDEDSGLGNKNTIFRVASGDENIDDEDIPEIQGRGSSVNGLVEAEMEAEPLQPVALEATAHACLHPPYNQSEKAEEFTVDLQKPIKLKPVRSKANSKASSNVSYFTYEDMTIASDECEVCAICLCPYEEGDTRIFSKRCPHAFHKECILEWLVKSHNECPCCRVEMVTKVEIKETSASLIGTERLAQAMSVAGAQMQESRVRRPTRVARQMIERMRAQRNRSRQAHENGDSPGMPPQSPNAHWLWSARFGNAQNSPSEEVVQSPGISLAPGGRPQFEESRPSTETNDNGNEYSSHNRDWLWAARFSTRSPGNSEQPRTIGPTRSADALMNSHEISQITTSHHSPHRNTSMHDATAGPLFSSAIHNHWQQPRQESTPRRGNQRLVSPLRHRHWLRQNSSSNENPDNLPVTVLPAI